MRRAVAHDRPRLGAFYRLRLLIGEVYVVEPGEPPALSGASPYQSPITFHFSLPPHLTCNPAACLQHLRHLPG
jgi:hypothetical protein